MSSSSYSRSSPGSNSPVPMRKRKQAEVESLDSESSENVDSSDTSSIDEEDTDAPQPLPPTKDIVLSHAERRRQKKKLKQEQHATSTGFPRKRHTPDDGVEVSPSFNVSANSEENTNAKAKSTAKVRADGAANDLKRQKRQNSVWVGNLAFRTTEEALRGFFDGVGTITRVHMPMRRGTQTHGENMGFAYVDLETPEAKVIAITLSEGQLDGRNLLVKDGDDFTGRPTKSKTNPAGGTGGEGEKPVPMAGGKSLSKTAQKILHTQKQLPAPTLFLGNLGFDTTEGSIRELFQAHRYGAHKKKRKGMDVYSDEGDDDAAKSKDVWIRKIRMGTFEDSGTCKGFAFVDFTSVEHATEVLVNPRNRRLNGRNLVVEYASPDAVRRGGGGPRNAKGDHNRKSTGRTAQKGSASAPYSKQRWPRHTERADDADGLDGVETPGEKTKTTPPSGRPGRAGHDGPHTRRAKPGAALAQAQRQTAAILPSQGQKFVF